MKDPTSRSTTDEHGMSMPLSAQGTRLNKRGIETRRRFIETAIHTLAEEGPASASANLVATRAGVTWGTVQHQFGDADGVWAAMLGEINAVLEDVELLPAAAQTSVPERVRLLIELVWESLGFPMVRASESLRMSLPRDHEVLAIEMPKTAAALRNVDEAWNDIWTELFADLPVSQQKLHRAQSMIGAAVRGLRFEDAMVGYYLDTDAGLEGLIEAVIAYLEANPS